MKKVNKSLKLYKEPKFKKRINLINEFKKPFTDAEWVKIRLFNLLPK
jgi:hypothetical protein